MSERRPLSITIISAFLFAASVMAAVVAFALLFPGRPLFSLAALNPRGMAAFEALGRVSGVLLLGIGAVSASSAAGLMRRKRWAWWVAMALFVVNGCGDVVSALVTHEWLRSISGFVVSSTFLYALTRLAARDHFDFRRTSERITSR